MQALVYEAPRVMKIRDIDIPVLQHDEVLIEVKFSGICGSELSGYLGQNSLRKPPLVFGHEFSGVISAIGESAKALRPDLTVGAAVTANPLVSCGDCRFCLRGLQQLCVSRKLLSASLPGSNADYVLVPARFVYRLPQTVSLEQGALAEPIACAVRAVELAAPAPDSTALVVGMGPIGLFVLQALKAHKVKRIIATDTNSERLQYATEAGAIAVNPREQNLEKVVEQITEGRGVDVALDAVGSQITRQTCVQHVSPAGNVVFVGLHEADSTLPINIMVRNEIRCTGSFAYGTTHFETALQWLAEGKAGLQSGIVKVPLAEGAEWFERLLQSPGNVSKVLLSPS